MSKSFKALVLCCFLGSLFLSGAIAQDNSLVSDQRPTGAIQLTAEQLEEVLTTWPRVDKVNFNWLGRQRINRIKALQGRTLLPLSALKAVGQEVESSINPAGAPAGPVILNEDLTGALPVFVDNSTDTDTAMFFPPIGNQGSQGSCAAWASTYYQLTYMTAFERSLNIYDPDVYSHTYSPKWSYNMVNGGSDSGSAIANIFTLIEKHGAVTWAEFPYVDTEYRAWCLDTAAWRTALSVRTRPSQTVWYTNTDAGIEVIKQLLANGYILTYNTYFYGWNFKTIVDDPSTTDDDAAVGKYVGYWVNTTTGGHSMTIVGYNDAIWTDINGNGTIDAGEKGALRIANSWGPGWNSTDGGFIWLAYDALKTISAVDGGPSTNREEAFWNHIAYIQTARDAYSPSLIAEFTINHLKRNHLTMRLGISDTTVTAPTTTWTPLALAAAGGAYAFDGTTTAVDGTFVLDYSDILPSTSATRRFYLTMVDSTSGDTATLSAFKIIDYSTEPDTEVVCSLVPQYADYSTVHSYVEYSYAGGTYNNPPRLSSAQVVPAAGTNLTTYAFYVYYYDMDGNAPAVMNVYIDDIPHAMTFDSGSASNGWYIYETTLAVGNHSYRYYCEDGQGESAQNPLSVNPPPYVTWPGPSVVLAHFVTTPTPPSGEQNPNLGQSYTYSTSGSTCYQGHDIQYKFNWGDGTSTDWLGAGVTSAPHTWRNSGVFSVKAQARCAVNNAIVSDLSDSLVVNAGVTTILAESFAGSTFPTGWTQQNIGVTNRWSLSATTNAGGSAYEMKCSWTSGTATTRLVTPAINTTGYSNLYMSFKHNFNTYTGVDLQVKIQSSPDGTIWTDEAWIITTPSSNMGPETINTTIANNLNIATTYIAFTIVGNLYNFNFWYIDDVSIAGVAAPAPGKIDFNGDGQEDILWRYYGSGGYNRAWFLGNTGGAGLPMATPGAPLATGLAGGKPAGNKSIERSPANSREMGVSSNLRKGSRVPTPRNIMGNMTRRTAGPGAVQDPRHAGGRVVRPSPVNVIDPRDVKLVRDPEAPGGAFAEVTGAPSLLGGADVLPVGDLNWQIVGTGHFNEDTSVDILWRNVSTGTNVVWLMNGTEWSSSVELLPVVDQTWQIVGTGDFNNDTHVDILWRNNSSGMNVVWYMDGTAWAASAVLLGVSDPSWQIVGTGDFDKDGNVDILWRNVTGGSNVVWYMNGANWSSSAELISVGDTAWQIRGTGDYNADGNVDILWRYNGAGGYNVIWYMNGVAWSSSAELLPVPDLTWRIVSR